MGIKMAGRAKHIELFDTTLRDGSQMLGVDFTVEDMLGITTELDKLGIQFIEGGWPGSRPVDTEFFKRAQSLNLDNASLVAFGMTCHKGRKPEEDKYLSQLPKSGAHIISLVGKSSKLHVEQVLEADLEENLRMIRESCAFIVKNGKSVFFDAEHFFDGFKADEDYALATIRAAVEGGAIRIILCDTNGGSLPLEVGHIIDRAKKEIDVPFGVHMHNDLQLAVANSIIAVDHGVLQVQGTINGYGERCGNADLCALIPVLQIKKGFECLLPQQLASLSRVSRFVAETANMPPNPYQPFVGEYAFTHKGGMHGQGQGKHKESYQHIDPELVGNFSDVAVSDRAGKSNIRLKAEKLGLELSAEETERILAEVKELGAQGFQFDAADASFELLVLRQKADYSPPFEISYRRLQSEKRKGGKPKDEATVRIVINNHKKRTTDQVAFSRNGTVDALDQAIRKTLRPQYGRTIRQVNLVDYKVRPVDGTKGARSFVRVLILFSDGKKTWTTVGVSADLLEASCQALTDGLEYAILKAR